ncbi:longitudinals lacking protein, isoforms H/M/V isoform X5 [Trichogramma pretiosum]|uniref:longitudinals lacking protein, isoforms H/M/V isoform X5 n=1 Tax=Trichogramma pretiosum TaxID=7493 RepID=UPI000C71A355|nr:longitudinals lacking protein, isoforms H/M/V isoform X5 [Trichogramma pretiosum]
MDDETQFCLKWHNHQSTLIRNFDTLLESGTLVDCTLAAEGRYLKAHKVVLSACSPYFEGLLSEHYDKHPVFILKDVKFVELKAMMDYMYRGEVNISQNQLTALLKAAESLQIKGLSDSKTTGSSNNSTVAGRVEPKSTATSTSNAVTTAVDIPQGSSGLTIEKNNKVPRQRLTQTSANMSEGGASPQQVRGISSREGSVSPTRKRRARRRSLGNDESNSMENHEASNSSDVTASATVMAAPTVEDKSHAESADPIGRSALMQQLTKSNDDMLQMQMEKPEPTEDMIQPKSEYMEDQESVEDLTHLDDDMNDLNEMEQDNSRAGPSHDSSHPGLASWHITSDRSNAGVGAAGGAQGADDAVFMNAHETNAAQRDSQDSSSIILIEDEVKQEPVHQFEEIFVEDFTESSSQVASNSAAQNKYQETDKINIQKEDLIKPEASNSKNVQVTKTFKKSISVNKSQIIKKPSQKKFDFPQISYSQTVINDRLVKVMEEVKITKTGVPYKVVTPLLTSNLDLCGKKIVKRGSVEVQEEIKIARKTPGQIAYKVVTPVGNLAKPDRFESWCMRNITANNANAILKSTMTSENENKRGSAVTKPNNSRP